MPLELVPRFLDHSEMREWKQIERDIQLAHADIETGQWLADKQYSPFVEKSKTDADRKKGQAMIDSGKAKLAELTVQQNALRTKAAESYQQYQSKFDAKSIGIEIKPMPLLKATEDPTEAMLYSLWNERYTKILFAGAYVLENGYYMKANGLSEQMLNAITKYDGNRYTLEEEVSDFTIENENGQPVIDFTDRVTMVSKFKPALLISEIIYDDESEYGIYALYAIDLKTGKLIDQTIHTFPNNELSQKLLAMSTAPANVTAPAETAETAPDTDPAATASKATEEINKPTDTKPAKEAPSLSITLVDDSNFMGRLGAARDKYTFGVAYIGQIDGFDHRTAVLLNKALMRNAGLKVDDYEFLTLALNPSSEEIEFETTANVVWRVSPTSPIKFGQGQYNVEAISNQSGEEATVEIGTLSVGTANGGSIPPQAANK
ncbi:hypothetical protein [Cerasicoccus arenae]|nr:hypothetical protein [Cerasicoccus arenae]MBK1856889.1 hypothetical protein [Cerasicoccus arenae]